MQRDGLTWLNYLMLAFYGYMLNILGPITPFLRDELDLSYTVGSFHFSAFAVGMIIAGLFGERLVQRFGRGRVFWTGSAGMVTGGLLITLGQSAVVTVAGALLTGTLGSVTFSLIPIFITRHHPATALRSLTEANFVSSVFSFLAPFLVSLVAGWVTGWRLALWLTIPVWAGLWFSFRRHTLPEIQPPQPTASAPATPAASTTFGPGFWWRWLAVLLVVGVEFCVLFWGPDYLRVRYGVDSSEAAAIIGFVLVGMFVGRAAGSLLLSRVSTTVLLLTSLSLVLIGGALVLLPGILPLQLKMLVIGLGIASLYPMTFEAALRRATGNPDAASSRLVLASGVAILGLPLLVGNFADQLGIEVVLPVAVLLLALLAAVLFPVMEARASSRTRTA